MSFGQPADLLDERPAGAAPAVAEDPAGLPRSRAASWLPGPLATHATDLLLRGEVEESIETLLPCPLAGTVFGALAPAPANELGQRPPGSTYPMAVVGFRTFSVHLTPGSQPVRTRPVPTGPRDNARCPLCPLFRSAWPASERPEGAQVQPARHRLARRWLCGCAGRQPNNRTFVHIMGVARWTPCPAHRETEA